MCVVCQSIAHLAYNNASPPSPHHFKPNRQPNRSTHNAPRPSTHPPPPTPTPHSHTHTHTHTHTLKPHTHRHTTDGRANVPLSKSIDIEPIGTDEMLAQLEAGEDGKPKKKDKEQEKKEREMIKVGLLYVYEHSYICIYVYVYEHNTVIYVCAYVRK